MCTRGFWLRLIVMEKSVTMYYTHVVHDPVPTDEASNLSHLNGRERYVGINIGNNQDKKDRWDSGKPRRQQTTLGDIQIKVVYH